MKGTFLCFKAEASLFLFPLESVCYVIPARQEDCGKDTFEGCEVETLPFPKLWGQEEASPGRYGIVVEKKGKRKIFLADEVSGIFELPRERLRELPAGVQSRRNSFLKGITYMEPLGGWGFVVDPEEIFELEGNGQ